MRLRSTAASCAKAFFCILFLVVCTMGCGGSGTSGAGGGGLSGLPTPSPTDSPPPTLQSLTVAPGSLTMSSGATEQFTARGTYSDGAVRDLTSQVTWSSSDPALHVSNVPGAHGLALALAPAPSVTVTATTSGFTGKANVVVSSHQLVSIGVIPASGAVASGTSLQFTAVGVYSDGRREDLTQTAAWTSSVPVVAANPVKGLATGLTVGQTTITASQAGVAGSAALRVTGATLTAIQVTPAVVSFAAGTTQAFEATGLFSDGTTQILTRQVAWTSSSPNLAIDASGHATGVAVASNVTVTATFGAVSGTARASVTAAVLTSIQVTPPGPAIPLGTAVTFRATGLFSDNTVQDLSDQVTWASSDPAVAYVDAHGLATSAGVGTCSVTAVLAGVTGTASLEVTAETLVSVEVQPAAASLARGTSVQLKAQGTFSNGSVLDLTEQVTWSSSTASVVVSNVPGSQGLAYGSAVGTASVSAIFEGERGSSSVTVTPATLQSLAVQPATLSIAKGTTGRLKAIGTFTDGTTEDLTTQAAWTSSALGVATVDARGLVTGVTAGQAVVTATFGGVGNFSSVTVTPAVLVSLAVQPAAATVRVQGTVQFNAVGTFSDNSTETVTDLATWTASSAAIMVSDAAGSKGLATGLAPVQDAQVRATIGARSATAQMTVAGLPTVVVPNQASNSLSVFTVRGDGVLAAVQGSPFATGARPQQSVITPDGRFTYSVNASSQQISGYRIDPVSSALVSLVGSPFRASLPAAMAITPDGRRAFVSNFGAPTMSVFTIDAASGALQLEATPGTLGTNAVSMAFDPSGRFLYSADLVFHGASTLSEYAVQGAGLTVVGNVPYGQDPLAMALNRAAPSLYVGLGNAGQVAGNIDILRRNADGTLTGLPPRESIASPGAMAVDPFGRFLFVAINTRDFSGLAVYRIEGDGRVSNTGVSFRVGRNPSGCAVDPSGRFVYVTNRGSNTVHGYAINASTGYLTEVAGSPFAVGSEPKGIVIGP